MSDASKHAWAIVRHVAWIILACLVLVLTGGIVYLVAAKRSAVEGRVTSPDKFRVIPLHPDMVAIYDGKRYVPTDLPAGVTSDRVTAVQVAPPEAPEAVHVEMHNDGVIDRKHPGPPTAGSAAERFHAREKP